MNAKTVLRSVATTVIIVGCAIAGPGLQPAGAQRVNCPGASCDVTVTVTGNPSYPTIAVSAGELKMEKARRNVMITWKLVNAPDYEFRAGSISSHVGAATPGKPTTTQAAWDAQCQFQNSNDKQYTVKNRNDAAVTLYYNVKVCRKATENCWTLDPAIMNEP